MACQILLEFRIKDGCHERLKEHFKRILPDTRDFDGCINLYMIRDLDDPSKVIVVEMWDTKEQYERYLQWRVDRGDLETLETMWESPTWRFLSFWGV